MISGRTAVTASFTAARSKPSTTTGCAPAALRLSLLSRLRVEATTWWPALISTGIKRFPIAPVPPARKIFIVASRARLCSQHKDEIGGRTVTSTISFGAERAGTRLRLAISFQRWRLFPALHCVPDVAEEQQRPQERNGSCQELHGIPPMARTRRRCDKQLTVIILALRRRCSSWRFHEREPMKNVQDGQ